MEVISETTSQTFNVNFDSLLKKYEDQGMYKNKLYHKQNFAIPLEDGTNCPAYIIIFHTDDVNDSQLGYNNEVSNASYLAISYFREIEISIKNFFREIKVSLFYI